MCHLVYISRKNADSFELSHRMNKKCTAKPAEGKYLHHNTSKKSLMNLGLLRHGFLLQTPEDERKWSKPSLFVSIQDVACLYIDCLTCWKILGVIKINSVFVFASPVCR